MRVRKWWLVNEDELFVRAIVGNPGDDTHRLVYADWLDERSDPRGSYLRAETEWAKGRRELSWTPPTTEPEREAVFALQCLATGLDQVWVARVSRPPVGVCCEHVVFERGVSPASEQAVRAYEEQVGFTLPTQYRALLLNHDGGRVYPDTVPGSGGVPSFRFFRQLDELARDTITLTTFHDVSTVLDELIEADPEPGARLLWIAGEEQVLMLQIDGQRVGRVRSCEGCDLSCSPAVVGSLGELLARMKSSDPDWVWLAIAGRTDELLRVLERGPGVNAQDGYWSPLYAATNWGREDTVRELLARGARVPPAYKGGRGYSLYPEIRQLLDEAFRRGK
jgi:uncharacterized protein (TIGR02996 family)